MGKSKREIAEIAAKWWAEAIVEPQHDNGDKSDLGFFAMVLAEFSSDMVEVESVNKFIEMLSKHIEVELNSEYEIILACDYSPCRILDEAAKGAGIPHYNFPWKTTMWIGNNSIKVRHGYSSGIKYLYSNKEYWLNKIGKSKDEIEELRTGKGFWWIEKDKQKEEIEKSIKMREDEIKYMQKLYEEAEE